MRTPSAEPASPRLDRVGGLDDTAIDRRRRLGVYYTPEGLAVILVRWALGQAVGPVLDPSYGGCAFLNAAARTLAEKGVENPGRLVYGVDIDPLCVDFARQSNQLVEENCVVGDFLQLSLADVANAPFPAIVGNPPYIRHHWLSDTTRSAARAIADRSSLNLPGTASAWAYFLVHALKFLAPGGRMAMLVPEAILQADYAASLRDGLAAQFSRVLLVHIRDRQFDGTHEPVVVVAASGFGEKGEVSVDAVERAEDLGGLLDGSTAEQGSEPLTVAKGRSVATATVQLLEELGQCDLVRTIADIATVRIGFVTGANSHFIRSKDDLQTLGVPSKARVPVVARTKWLSGLNFTAKDHENLVASGGRAFLVRPPPNCDEHPGVQRWIGEGRAAGVKERFKCSGRTDWFRLALPPIPGAFATCTRLGSPLLVLNRAGIRCSNALHSVRWISTASTTPEVVAAGFLTSAVAVWAELHGRRYGGGVLKLEPGALKRVPVPMVPSIQEAYGKLDQLLRKGDEEKARKLADELALGNGLGLTKAMIKRLQEARLDLMRQRRPTRNRIQHG